MKLRIIGLSVLTILTVIGIIFFNSVKAQIPKTQDSITSSDQQVFCDMLTTEIRQLRVAIQRNSLSALRGQILLDHARSQRDLVDSLTTQLYVLRTELTSGRSQILHLQDRLRTFETELGNEQDQTRRSQIDVERRTLQQIIDAQLAHQQQLQEREANLSVKLESEQATLSTLMGQLQTVEREMERQLITSQRVQ